MNRLVIVGRDGSPDSELLQRAHDELGLAQAAPEPPAAPVPLGIRPAPGLRVDASVADQVRSQIEVWLGDQGYSACRVVVENAA